MILVPKAAWSILAGAALQTEPIVTDRPDFTESSIVVPPGRAQVESGLTLARTKPGERSTNGPEVLVRTSLSERTEFRLGLPNFSRIDAGGSAVRGWGDLYVGFKHQIGPVCQGLGLALIPAVLIPVGDRNIRSEAWAPELKVCWSKELAGDRALSGMVYVSRPKVDGERSTLLQHTVSLGVPVRDRVGAFFEHVVDFEKGSGPSHLFHTGFTYQPRPAAQFDVHFGVGLTRGAPDFFIAGGYSIRL